jgi:hypothetical protein
MRNVLTDVWVSFSKNRLFLVCQLYFSCGPQVEPGDFPPVISDSESRSPFSASQFERTNLFNLWIETGDATTNLGRPTPL